MNAQRNAPVLNESFGNQLCVAFATFPADLPAALPSICFSIDQNGFFLPVR
jgi:hypothetical protein